jgi:hypothetical protein
MTKDKKLSQRDDEMRSISITQTKTVKMRARHEGRGFSDGSIQVVRDQTARNNNAEIRLPYPLREKRRRCEQFKKRAENLQGAYIDVRDRKLPQRDDEMRRIYVVFYQSCFLSDLSFTSS